MIENIIGFVAGFFIAVSMIPQVIKSYKTKSVEDISFLMLIIIALGAFLWTVYGMLIKSLPVAIMDGVAFFIGLTQIFIKMKYRKK